MEESDLPEGVNLDILRKLRERVQKGLMEGKSPDDVVEKTEEKEKLKMVIGGIALSRTLRALQEETDDGRWWSSYHPEEAKRLSDLAGIDLTALFLENRAKSLAAVIIDQTDMITHNGNDGDGLYVRINEVYEKVKEGGLDYLYQGLDSAGSLQHLAQFGFDVDDATRQRVRGDLGKVAIDAYTALQEVSSITASWKSVGEKSVEAATNHILNTLGRQFFASVQQAKQ